MIVQPPPRGEARVHAPGDGYHLLPVQTVVGARWRAVSSVPCVLLLFVRWAQMRDHDPISLYRRAHPSGPGLRPDRLLPFGRWIIDVERSDAIALGEDLQSIGEDGLLELIIDVERGTRLAPPAFTHWLRDERGELVGEARDLEPATPDELGQHHCFIRILRTPELAEWAFVDAERLLPKGDPCTAPLLP